MNRKRNIKLTERLSFSFGVILVLLMIILPLAASTYSYSKSISDFTEYNTDTLKHISVLLKNNYSTEHDDFINRAEVLRNEFGLPFISYISASSDNSKIKRIVEISQSENKTDEYAKSSASYYKEVSPEITQLLSEVLENGTVVSRTDVFEGEYGKTLTSYTLDDDNSGETGIICVGLDIAKAERTALLDSLIIAFVIEAIVAFFGSIYMKYIGKHCTERLKRLSESISEYARIKDPIIAEQIRQNEKGDDEIAVLSQQTASMMSELQNHINKIIDISSELLTANEQAEKFSKLARKDALTGLENKMAYYEAVNRLDAQIQEGTAEFAFVVIDLNFLKRINDECGHNYGDIMIKKLADLIKDFFGNCKSYRIGGDEFAVILDGEISKKSLTLVSKFQLLLKEGSSSGYKNFPSAAVGCANYRASVDTSVKEVFDRADNEMYGNKVQMKAVRKD